MMDMMAVIADEHDKALAGIYRVLKEARRQNERIGTLFDAIAHGDEEHRAWLKKAIEDHFLGRPVERPPR